jgi:hypothetical protein
MKKTKSAKQKLPPGWTARQIRELASYYDNLTEDQQVAEIEAGLAKDGQTVMVVPTELVPAIREFIFRKRPA